MGEVNAYIGLGSNLGDRHDNIQRAIDLLGKTPGIRVDHISEMLETEPIGKLDQPRFINCVAEVHTQLDPFKLHETCLGIEKALGRVRIERWGPRLIDLDILLYGKESIRHPTLTIPHPEISNRPFVQLGLKELGVG